MTCSQVRRELLGQFGFREEVGPRSEPHLAHLESCADCRREVGVDRELVRHLQRALRERVDGSAPSAASWEHVRRRTVDRPARPWAVRVLRWGGMVPAAVAGVMVFAIAAASENGLLPGIQSPSSAEQAFAPAARASGWQPSRWEVYQAPQAVFAAPLWPVEGRSDHVATGFGDMPPISGRMR